MIIVHGVFDLTSSWRVNNIFILLNEVDIQKYMIALKKKQ